MQWATRGHSRCPVRFSFGLHICVALLCTDSPTVGPASVFTMRAHYSPHCSISIITAYRASITCATCGL